LADRQPQPHPHQLLRCRSAHRRVHVHMHTLVEVGGGCVCRHASVWLRIYVCVRVCLCMYACLCALVAVGRAVPRALGSSCTANWAKAKRSMGRVRSKATHPTHAGEQRFSPKKPWGSCCEHVCIRTCIQLARSLSRCAYACLGRRGRTGKIVVNLSIVLDHAQCVRAHGRHGRRLPYLLSVHIQHISYHLLHRRFWPHRHRHRLLRLVTDTHRHTHTHGRAQVHTHKPTYIHTDTHARPPQHE
jgi:hypothetical protein